jgi:hypothetical protein
VRGERNNNKKICGNENWTGAKKKEGITKQMQVIYGREFHFMII